MIRGIENLVIEHFDKAYTVNLRSTFLLTKLSLPRMKQQKWGRIVFVSSIATEGGVINGCHYAASNAGLNGMKRNL